MTVIEQSILNKLNSLQKDIEQIKSALLTDKDLINLNEACRLSGLSPYKIKKYPFLKDNKATGQNIYIRAKCVAFKLENSHF